MGHHIHKLDFYELLDYPFFADLFKLKAIQKIIDVYFCNYGKPFSRFFVLLVIVDLCTTDFNICRTKRKDK